MLQIKEVIIDHQGAVARYTSLEGFPAALVSEMVVVKTQDDRHFYLPAFRAPTPAEMELREGEEPGRPVPVYQGRVDELVGKINQRGSIDETWWVEFEPDTRSLQEKLGEDAEREAFERGGWGMQY